MALKVLLVDDSVLMRQVLSRTLKQAGLDVGHVFEAGDGLEAMRVLESGTRIDVVLCDWNMPNMNGPDFVEAARSKGHRLPIVIVTTEAGEAHIEQAKTAGADAFVTKPFTAERLAAALFPILALA